MATPIFGRISSPSGPRFIVVQDEAIHAITGDVFSDWTRGEALSSDVLEAPLAPVSPATVAAPSAATTKPTPRSWATKCPKSPLLFLKPVSSIIDPGRPIVLPPESSRVDHEGELAVIVGRVCRRISQVEAHKFVFGYTAANDVSARDLQQRDGQWSRAKGFDSFCPLGPWIVPGMPPSDTRVACYVNGELRQESVIDNLIFPIPQLIDHVSAVMTLQPGDVILTGTPAGVGPLQPGDTVRVEVGESGRLEKPGDCRIGPDGEPAMTANGARHFLSVTDYAPDELRELLSLARRLKQQPQQRLLAGRSIALIFEKPSLRTRLSFDVAGGAARGTRRVSQSGSDRDRRSGALGRHRPRPEPDGRWSSAPYLPA